MLAAALLLTACQQADPSDSAGEPDATATASPTGSGEGPSSGSGEGGDAEPTDAEVSASALPDHLQPPTNETTQAMIQATEKGLGRPVTDVQGKDVAAHERDTATTVEMFETNPGVAPVNSEQCREIVLDMYRTASESTARSTTLRGQEGTAGGAAGATGGAADEANPPMPAAVSLPYTVTVTTYEDAASAAKNMDALLAVQENEDCRGEPMLGFGAAEDVTEQDWGQGTRYTAVYENETQGIVHMTTLAVDGTRVIEIRDGGFPGQTDTEKVLAAHAKTVDLLAEALGEPVRD